VFFLAGGAVDWKSVMQKTVATSSTAAEYIALSDAARSVVGMRNFLASLGYPQEAPTILYEDNSGAICIARGAGRPERSRHLDIRYHYVKELVASGVVSVEYISTDLQLADGLTKSLEKVKFKRFVEAVM
jgi:hypothetical protein